MEYFIATDIVEGADDNALMIFCEGGHAKLFVLKVESDKVRVSVHSTQQKETVLERHEHPYESHAILVFRQQNERSQNRMFHRYASSKSRTMNPFSVRSSQHRRQRRRSEFLRLLRSPPVVRPSPFGRTVFTIYRTVDLAFLCCWGQGAGGIYLLMT